MIYHLTPASSNSKTGPLPVSTTSGDSCPAACPLKRGGCYAKTSHLGMHWAAVNRGERGGSLAEFLEAVRRLPRHQLWRHNQAGDLPGAGNRIDAGALAELVKANREAIAAATRGGFTINLSCNSLAHLDRVAADNPGAPLAVVLPASAEAEAKAGKRSLLSPAGRKVVVCPASYREGVSCASCGLCQVASRSVAVGFPAHGSDKHKADAISRN